MTSAFIACAVIAGGTNAVVIAVEGDAATLVPPDVLVEKLSHELGVPAFAQASTTDPSRGVLSVARSGQRIRLTWHDRTGGSTTRILSGAGERAPSLEAIARVAANLVRSEADELLTELTRPSTATATVEPAPQLGVALAAAPPPSESEARWSFGVAAQAWTRSAEPVYLPSAGFFVAWSPLRHLTVGLTDLLAFPNEGRTVLAGGPYVELFSRVGRWFQLFGQLGAPLQARWGGNTPTAMGALIFSGIGARVSLWDRVTIGLAARIGVVVSAAFSTPPTELVQGSVVPSAGLELAFHL
jgi:hypothetical protein